MTRYKINWDGKNFQTQLYTGKTDRRGKKGNVKSAGWFGKNITLETNIQVNKNSFINHLNSQGANLTKSSLFSRGSKNKDVIREAKARLGCQNTKNESQTNHTNLSHNSTSEPEVINPIEHTKNESKTSRSSFSDERKSEKPEVINPIEHTKNESQTTDSSFSHERKSEPEVIKPISNTKEVLSPESELKYEETESELKDTASEINEAKIRKKLESHQIDEEYIVRTIEVIKEICAQSTLFGKPLQFNEYDMVYLRKSDTIPLTMEAHRNGNVYIHFKSHQDGTKDLIAEACQKRVYKSINQAGEVFAASVIREVLITESNKDTFDTERTALTVFKGWPYIIKGFGVSYYQGKYGLLTEYCGGRTSREFFKETLKTPKERIEFFLNILIGVKSIHDQGFVHFDLRGANILYKEVNNNYEPRIIDFGVMQPMGTSLKRNFRGTYVPAECDKHPYSVTEKVDVWALGIYAEDNLLANGDQMDSSIADLTSIIKQMLESDPKNRFTMAQSIQEIQNLLSKF